MPRTTMDRTEQIAEEHLRSRGFTDVAYEPDGNVPPDFLVNGGIGVEVRRLNQNKETASGPRGLEELAIPVTKGVRQLLPQFGPSHAGESWYVMYYFERPLPSWKVLATTLKSTLSEFKARPKREACRLQVVRGFEVQLLRAARTYPDFFVLGAWADGDSGGFVLKELIKNIRICVEEKTGKISKVRARYPEWWLFLVDYVAHAIDPEDQDALRQLLTLDHM
jgi:hypothetical protein